MIFNKQIKNGNKTVKLPITAITAIVFSRTRIKLRNPSIVFLSFYSVPRSFINIQDTKFKWYLLRNLQINGHFEHFKIAF